MPKRIISLHCIFKDIQKNDLVEPSFGFILHYDIITYIGIHRLLHDMPQSLVLFLGEKILLLRLTNITITHSMHSLFTFLGPRNHSNCLPYSSSCRASEHLVGVSI